MDGRIQVAWDEVMKDPLNDAQKLPIKLGDTRWSYNDGWIKYESEFVEARIHLNYNPWIDAFDDFKFKTVVNKGGAR
jgi:hypothetical protein